ncbi:hypothetical protein ACJJTC_014891 [Scirpophaga incertulas]
MVRQHRPHATRPSIGGKLSRSACGFIIVLLRYDNNCVSFNCVIICRYFKQRHQLITQGKISPALSADGVGGFLKRSADKIVANGDDISDVLQFYDKMNNVSRIKHYLINVNKIDDLHKALPVNIPRLVGTLKVHQVFSSCYGKLRFRDLSCFCETGGPEGRGFCLCVNPKAYDIEVCYGAQVIGQSFFISNMTNDETVPNNTTEQIDLIATNDNLELTNRNLSSKIPDMETADLDIMSDDDDEPLCNLKLAKQLQDVTNRHRRIYDAIYGGLVIGRRITKWQS